MKAVIDNDIVFKGSCYGLLNGMVYSECGDVAVTGALGAARFVVAKQIKKTHLNGGIAQAISTLEAFMGRCQVLEPTEHEQSTAADIELAAQKLHLSLHSGESQLCAIAIARSIARMLTGDKRAIVALETLMDAYGELSSLGGRIKCLEQIVLAMLEKANPDEVRMAICAEPAVDKALSICFSCTNVAVVVEQCAEGLRSYIGDLRKQASRILAE